MMKKFLSLSFGLLLLVSLASCGESNPETAEDASDRKTVENETFTITGKDYDDAGELYTFEAEGQYSGEILDGIPDGQGTFTSQNEDGILWTYSGEFKNGVFNGKGETTWSDTKWKEAGTYTDGLFTPNTFELFDSISATEIAPYTISERNQEFMESHLDLFPAKTEAAQETMSSLIQKDMTYPMMCKTLTGLEGKLYQCESAVANQVMQTSYFGHTMTRMSCQDQDQNYYYILYNGALPDVYDRTPISFVGLPVSPSGYENVAGGTTNVIVLIATSVTTI